MELARDFGDFLVRTVYHYGYLIGTRGQKCTPELIQRSWNSFPAYRPKIEECADNWLVGNPDKGKVNPETGLLEEDDNEWKVADCMGWFETFHNGGDIGNPLTNNELVNGDVSTGVVYSLAKSMGLPNGPISTLPQNCPYPINIGYDGHVGFYHLGKVYQSAGHCPGTVVVSLTDRRYNRDWDFWYVNPYLDYEGWDFEGDNNMILQKGCEAGQMVYNYQIICKKLSGAVGTFNDMVLKDAAGIPLKTGCDGDYGDTMVKVTNDFCIKYGLPTTTLGTVTDTLMGKLNAALQALITGVPQAQYDAVVAQLNAANAQIATLTTQLNTANAKIADLTNQLNAEKAKVAMLTSQLTTANAKITDLTTQLNAEKAKNATLTSQLNTANLQIATLTNQLATANAKIVDLNNQLNAEKAKNSNLSVELAEVTEDRDAKLNDLETIAAAQDIIDKY